jgi:cytidylate kinase
MPIIFICSVPFGGGESLGKKVAQKLGCRYVGREEIVSRANECGIPVGKLEVAAVKKPAFQEHMARLKERYLAVATAAICERAAEEDIVYYGRAAHLLLPGVSHTLRVRVIPDHEQRVENAMQRTRLSKEKAEKFLAEVDGDIRNWVRFIHGVDVEDPRKYDFILNLERTSLESAATALCAIADLPDFKPTPASRKAMEASLLQSRARTALALDERTSNLDLTVRSSEGVVTITYMPRQAAEAHLIPDVLANLPGCRELHCTMASTNILWIQEDFRADSPAFAEVTELARRWGAAVELLRYRPEEAGEIEAVRTESAPLGPHYRSDGGVEDDSQEKPVGEEEAAFRATLEALVGEGRSGGAQFVAGPRERVLEAISSTIPYSLVVVGNLYANKSAAARTRLTRDFTSFLARNIKVSVVSLAELGDRLRVRPKQMARAAFAMLVVAILYAVLFLKQDTFLQLLGGEAHKANPWIAPVLIVILAPVVAWLYGQVAGFLLRLFKFE